MSEADLQKNPLEVVRVTLVSEIHPLIRNILAKDGQVIAVVEYVASGVHSSLGLNVALNRSRTLSVAFKSPNTMRHST